MSGMVSGTVPIGPVQGVAAELAYFSESVPGTDTVRLAAAVAWRREPAAHTGQSPTTWLRRLGRQITARFRAAGSGNCAEVSFGLDGAQRAHFDVDRRLLHVLGRSYPLPPGERTLVLLVDVTSRPGDQPRVTARTVPVPTIAAGVRAPKDSTPGSEGAANRLADSLAGAHAEWAAALRTNLEVRRFLDSDLAP